MVDFVKPIEQANKLCENLSGICSADFQMLFSTFSAESKPAICKNTTDNLLSSNPTVFVIAGKGVRSIIQEALLPIDILICK